MQNFHDPLKYYEILDVTPQTSEDVIKTKYREKAKFWHPDHNPSPNAMENFKNISIAYDILKDEKSKLTYDLLSLVYNETNFPDVDAITLFLNSANRFDPNMRAVIINRVFGMIVKTSANKERKFMTFAEAKKSLFKSALSNWLFGWWSLTAPAKNWNAISENLDVLKTNKRENLKLFIHNMIALAKENKPQQALALAELAKNYTDDEREKMLISDFIKNLGLPETKPLPDWNYKTLKTVQFLIPGLIIFIIFVAVNAAIFSRSYFSSNTREINYSQKVKGMEGKTTFDDVVVGKILSIPVDTNDTSMLFHTKSSVDVMYGPSDDFDVLFNLKSGHTVRITGYTPDEVWYRVMLDNGEDGFVRGKYLQKGIGNEIPANSKIYQ